MIWKIDSPCLVCGKEMGNIQDDPTNNDLEKFHKWCCKESNSEFACHFVVKGFEVIPLDNHFEICSLWVQGKNDIGFFLFGYSSVDLLMNRVRIECPKQDVYIDLSSPMNSPEEFLQWVNDFPEYLL